MRHRQTSSAYLQPLKEVHMPLKPSDTTTIANLINELATELDLQYEDHELAGIGSSIDALRAAAEILGRMGGEVPETYQHILSRYQDAVS